MASSISYCGYVARVEYDLRDNMFIGRVDLRDGAVISFYCETIRDLNVAFIAAIDDYLVGCSERGISPEQSASGVLMRLFGQEKNPSALNSIALGRIYARTGTRRTLRYGDTRILCVNFVTSPANHCFGATRRQATA